MANTTINSLTAPFLSSPFIQSFAPASLTGAAPHMSTPQAWLCCHCIHYDSATNAQNLLAANSCSHCGHDRCGFCDTIVDDQSPSVSGEGMLFHLDEGQKKAKQAPELRDEKTGQEWTLGNTHMGAGSVMAMGAASVVAAAGVLSAVVLAY